MTYQLAIGDRTYSSWSLRGWLLFAKFNIPVEIDSLVMNSPEFNKALENYGGSKLVPVIRIEENGANTIVQDTIAIAETLNERHPDKQMWPTNSIARGYARTIVAEMHCGFHAIRGDCTMNLRHRYTGFTPSDSVLNELARIETIWAEARKLATEGPWLFGEYSIADAFFAPIATRIATYQLPVSPESDVYVNTVLSDSTFKTWRNAGLAENHIQDGYDLDLEKAPWPNV